MFAINSNVRSFLSYLGAAVPVSCAWAWYKTTDKVEQFARVQQGYAILTGARIGYEFAKRGRYFTAVMIGTASALAIKSAFESSSGRTVRTILALSMVVAVVVEWLTKDKTGSEGGRPAVIKMKRVPNEDEDGLMALELEWHSGDNLTLIEEPGPRPLAEEEHDDNIEAANQGLDEHLERVRARDLAAEAPQPAPLAPPPAAVANGASAVPRPEYCPPPQERRSAY